MEFLYPFLIAFTLVFISELGDKTQLLVLSFSSKIKSITILLGVALGSLLSHGVAIAFGSFLGNIESSIFHTILKFITYLSFIIFGILTFSPKGSQNESSSSTLNKISSLHLNYIFIIAFSIAIGELGDKTFLASIGLGVQYPIHKISLILGAISGMILSDSIAIIFGKFLSKKLPENLIEKFSGILFLLFGFIGLVNFLYTYLF